MIIGYDKYFLVERDNTFWSWNRGWVWEKRLATRVGSSTAEELVELLPGNLKVVQESELRFVRRAPVRRYATFGSEYWEILRDEERFGTVSQVSREGEENFGKWRIRVIEPGEGEEWSQMGPYFDNVEEAKQFARENII